MPNQYGPNASCTYYGGSGLIVAMQPEYFRNCPNCRAALTLERHIGLIDRSPRRRPSLAKTRKKAPSDFRRPRPLHPR